jgi:hypothetical protein
MAKQVKKPLIEISFCCQMCDKNYGRATIDPNNLFRINEKIRNWYLQHITTDEEHIAALPKKYKKKVTA